MFKMIYCFSGILQTEIENVKELGNSHQIRKIRSAGCPGRIPDVLFFNHVVARGFKFMIEEVKN